GIDGEAVGGRKRARCWMQFAEHDLGSLQRGEEKPAELRLRCVTSSPAASTRASKSPWRRRLLTIQTKRPISEALICNARYFEYIRHWAKLPAINQRPGCGVRVYILRNSSPSPNPQIGPTRVATLLPNNLRTKCSWPL